MERGRHPASKPTVFHAERGQPGTIRREWGRRGFAFRAFRDRGPRARAFRFAIVPQADCLCRHGAMAGHNKHASPRRVGGGRSDRYKERRERGGAGRVSRTAEWSDAAAAAVMAQLLAGKAALGVTLVR